MILDCLRERTRAAHGRLEARSDICACSTSLTVYRDLLGKFYGFYLPLESRLANVLASGLPDFDFAARRKACLLQQDFPLLGVSTKRIGTFPLCRQLPALDALPLALGCLYVVEGATLGGKIISRHLQTTLQLDATSGAAFFNGYGSETGRMWRAFGEMLTRYTETHAEDERILQGAVDTFASFEAWFAQGDVGYE